MGVDEAEIQAELEQASMLEPIPEVGHLLINFFMINFFDPFYLVLWLGFCDYSDSKAHGANLGPTWGQQDPGGHMKIAIWVVD